MRLTSLRKTRLQPAEWQGIDDHGNRIYMINHFGFLRVLQAGQEIVFKRTGKLNLTEAELAEALQGLIVLPDNIG
jgi:hypothetical protein